MESATYAREPAKLGKCQGDRQRVVIGSRNRAVYLGLAGANVSPRENPINRSSVFQKRMRSCSHVLIGKFVTKLRVTDRGSGRLPGCIEIQVASEKNGCVAVISAGVVQSFVQLRTAQPIVALALQMQVVGDERFPSDVSLTDQRQAPSNPFLKRLNIGKEPMRPPEIQLLLE